jgi:hypothetical protein
MFENGTYVTAIVRGIRHYGFIIDYRVKYGGSIQYTIISDDSEWLYVNDDKVDLYVY